MAVPEGARERILYYLKTKGPQTATQLAKRLRVTPMAVRQHLYALDEAGLVAYADQSGKVGRPARMWRVTDAAVDHFPDSHADLAVALIEAMGTVYGKQGMERLVAERTRQQVARYQTRVRTSDPLHRQVAALAALRREEGYMAEWSRSGDGGCVLVENNCPICVAAEMCQGLCAGELNLFRTVLGDRVTVERTEYALDGDRRCAYRIAPLGRGTR